MSGLREEALRFGEGGRLAGIVTLPDAPARGAAVLVTAGLTPKAGPFGLYAMLARRLAGSGLLVLRFDLGGIGDSAAMPGALPLEERTRLEVSAAVDLVRGRAPRGPLVLGGLCSGAEDSFRHAAEDERVTDVFMIDPFAFRTFGWRWRNALIRAARKSLALSGMLPTAAPKEQASLVDYRSMERAEAVARMKVLVERGVRSHFIYTGGARETFNHKRQFRAMFRGVKLAGLAHVDHFPQLRHTQVLESDRRLVVEAVARALEARAS